MSTINVKVLSRDAYPKKFAHAIQVITSDNNIMEMYLPEDKLTKFEQGHYYKLIGCNSFTLKTTGKNALKVTSKTRVSRPTFIVFFINIIQLAFK